MAGLLDRFQKVLGKLTPERTPAQLLLIEMQEHVEEDPSVTYDVRRVNGVAALLEGDEAFQREVLLEAVSQLGTGSYSHKLYLLTGLIDLLVAHKLDLPAPAAAALLRGAAQPEAIHTLKLARVLKQVEGFAPPLDAELRAAIEAFTKSAEKRLASKDYQKLKPRLAELLHEEPRLEAGGAFSEAIFKQVAALPEAERAAFRDLFTLAVAFTGARPTAKWSNDVRAVVARIGPEVFAARAKAWLRLGPTPGAKKEAWVRDTDAPYLRALVFAVGVMGLSPLADEIGDFALACYRKIPRVGPVSQGAGNACLWTLGELGLEGVGQLGKLKTRVKYAVALRLIEKALADAALRSGMSPEDLEEVGVPTCELDAQSRSEHPLGDVTARLEIVEGEHVKLSFVPPGGRAQVSPPVALKGSPELKALKARAKEIDAMLVAQRLRIERLFLTDRVWPFETWRMRLFEHPLLQGIARRLIWVLGSRAFACEEGKLVDVTGATVQPKSDEKVALWHPLDRSEAERDAWARWLDKRGLQTPFKQADREVYTLSEGVTATSRFSARPIAQHRFHALCRERGWAYRLQGGFDSANNATLALPRWKLGAELDVMAYGSELSPAGIFLEVALGQLEFTLDDSVPPRVLSEVMRDVALFAEL